MPDFDTLLDAHDELVLAELRAIIFFGPMSLEVPDTLEDPVTGDLLIPAGFESAGMIEKGAGISLTHDTDSTDIEAYGFSEPVRTIISKRSTSFDADFLETRKEVLEKFWASNFETQGAVSEHGGVTFKAPKLPKNIFYRCLIVGLDDVDGEDLFPYWIFPKVKLSNVDNQDIKDDGASSYKMTFQAYTDNEAGFPTLQGWCGPGWRQLVDKTGFVAPTTAIVATPATASIAVAATQQVTVVGDNGVNRTPDATYDTSAAGTATVSSTGLVTGVAAGSATITATFVPYPGATPLTDTVAVTVT
jgi:hypothetical protein